MRSKTRWRSTAPDLLACGPRRPTSSSRPWLGAQLLDNVSNVYPELRNRLRFLLGLLYDLTAATIYRADGWSRSTGSRRRRRRRSRAKSSVLPRVDLHAAYLAIQRSPKKICPRSTATRLRTGLLVGAERRSAPQARSRRCSRRFRTLSVTRADPLVQPPKRRGSRYPRRRAATTSRSSTSRSRASKRSTKTRSPHGRCSSTPRQVAASEGIRDFPARRIRRGPSRILRPLRRPRRRPTRSPRRLVSPRAHYIAAEHGRPIDVATGGARVELFPAAGEKMPTLLEIPAARHRPRAPNALAPLRRNRARLGTRLVTLSHSAFAPQALSPQPLSS